MLTSSRSVSFESAGIPSVVRSASSQSVSSRKASHRVPVQILEGHANSVNCVCFCLDEDKLVTGSFENTLRIWNRTTGAVEVLRGHSGKVRDVDVSRDGKMIVSGSNDETVRIWNRELGETMHVCEGHKGWVRSVQFSPDSSRVVSGSKDSTVRVWSAETGNWHSSQSSAMERSTVFATRLAETGSLQGQTASKYGTLKLEVESSHSETRRSSRLPGLLTGRTSSGDARAKSRSGILTPENNYARGRLTTTGSHSHSRLREITWRLAITGATPQPSYSISTGEQIAVLQHNVSVKGIAYSPSGKFIATGCEDSKVYLWEAPVVEDPPAKSSASSFSSFLDRPAVPLAGPSRNNERELDAFWDTLPNRNQQAPPQREPQREPQRVFDKVRNTFTNIFTRRSTGATQAISQSPVRETVKPVQVAAGRDKVFWVVVLIPTYNAVERFLYTLIHCRKPEDPDEEVPAATGTNTSQTAVDNAAASNQSGKPGTGDGTENGLTLAGNLVIRTQPQRTAAMRLSGQSPSTEPSPSEIPVGDSQVYNQPESIEMVAIPETSTVSAHASLHRTPSTDPLSSAVTYHEPSATSVAVTSAPLSASSNTSHSPSARSPSHDADDLVTVTVSRAEWTNLQDVRRRGQGTSTFVTKAADSPTGPEHDHDSAVYPSTSFRGSPAHVTRNTPPIHRPSSQPSSHLHAHPSRSLVGLDPLLHVVPSLLSPSPLSAPLGHSHLLHPPLTANVQSLGLHLMAPGEDLHTEAPLDPVAQLTQRRAANDDEID